MSVRMIILVVTLLQSACTVAGEFKPPVVPSTLDWRQEISNPTPISDSVDPKRYMIRWNDTPSIDGDFIFVIHPTQVFLRSSHNNPNPNLVYWVAKLEQKAYEVLTNQLDGYDGEVFDLDLNGAYPGYTVFQLTNAKLSPFLKDGASSEDVSAWQRKTDSVVNENLKKVLAELNRLLTKKGAKKLSEHVEIGDLKHRVKIADR